MPKEKKISVKHYLNKRVVGVDGNHPVYMRIIFDRHITDIKSQYHLFGKASDSRMFKEIYNNVNAESFHLNDENFKSIEFQQLFEFESKLVIDSISEIHSANQDGFNILKSSKVPAYIHEVTKPITLIFDTLFKEDLIVFLRKHDTQLGLLVTNERSFYETYLSLKKYFNYPLPPVFDEYAEIINSSWVQCPLISYWCEKEKDSDLRKYLEKYDAGEGVLNMLNGYYISVSSDAIRNLK